MADSSSATGNKHPVEQGVVGKSLNFLLKLISVLLLALFFSIIAEWIGMAFFWPDEGAQHSQDMLKAEIGFLNEDFHKSIITSSPAKFADEFAQKGNYYLIEWTGFIKVINWLSAKPTANSNDIHIYLHHFFMGIWEYVLAMLGVIQVFFVRLAVLLLATPVFFLAVIAGFGDGLVQRDLRRWGGGRESSFMYHYAKKFIMPSIIGAWVIYLAIPITVHPSFIIVPFVIMTASSAAIAASTFKKYL